MKSLITASLPILLLTYPLAVLLYARSLNKLVKLSKTTSNTIFGHLYINLSQIISDLRFTKTLWSGRQIQYVDNEQLKRLLSKTRLKLIFTTYFGLLIALIFIINKILPAS